MSEEIIDRIKNATSEKLGVAVESITEESNFSDDLGADSLDLVELVMAFEEEFGVEIPDEMAEEVNTVGDALRIVKEQTE